MDHLISSATPTLIAPPTSYFRESLLKTYLDGIGQRRPMFDMWLQPVKKPIISRNFSATRFTTASIQGFPDSDIPVPHTPPLLYTFLGLQANAVCDQFPCDLCHSHILVIPQGRVVQMLISSDLFNETFFNLVHGNVKTLLLLFFCSLLLAVCIYRQCIPITAM